MFILKSYQGRNLKISFNYYLSSFLVFLLAKFVITLSQSSCLPMLDSMLSLATSTSGVCDIVDRKQFFASLSLLKDLSADSTVAGIVKNILKLIQTFGNNSHKPHGPKAGDHCFEAFSRNTVVSFSCVISNRFLGMSANPKLTFDQSLYPVAAQLIISKMHSTPPRCTISTCVLHCSYLLI